MIEGISFSQIRQFIKPNRWISLPTFSFLVCFYGFASLISSARFFLLLISILYSSDFLPTSQAVCHLTTAGEQNSLAENETNCDFPWFWGASVQVLPGLRPGGLAMPGGRSEVASWHICSWCSLPAKGPWSSFMEALTRCWANQLNQLPSVVVLGHCFNKGPKQKLTDLLNLHNVTSATFFFFFFWSYHNLLIFLIKV